MIIKICEYCGIEYTPKNREEQGRKSKFCSPKCHTSFPKSEETKKKQSDSLKGKPSPLKGRHLPEETRLKMRLAHLNKPNIGQFKKGTPKELHPRWLGGISFLPYCFKFNNELKEKIRD